MTFIFHLNNFELSVFYKVYAILQPNLLNSLCFLSRGKDRFTYKENEVDCAFDVDAKKCL